MGTTEEPGEECAGWCESNTHPVDMKCSYDHCQGCSWCEGVEPPTEECKPWCESNTNPTARKCSWANCLACDFCGSETTTTTPEPEPEPEDCNDLNGSECHGCLATNDVCYDEPKAWCDLWPEYKWC